MSSLPDITEQDLDALVPGAVPDPEALDGTQVCRRLSGAEASERRGSGSAWGSRPISPSFTRRVSDQTSESGPLSPGFRDDIEVQEFQRSAPSDESDEEYDAFGDELAQASRASRHNLLLPRSSVAAPDAMRKSRCPRATVTTFDGQDHAHIREALRKALREAAGGSEKAFRQLDLNANGSISVQELADGLKRMKLDWQSITGLTCERKLLSLFDKDHNSAIEAKELFPSEVRLASPPPRISTPEFWRRWDSMAETARGPRWRKDDLADRLRLHKQASWVDQEVASQRKWIAQHFRLLREEGQSPSHCREWLADHLPHTSRRARDRVKTFNRRNASVCKQNYLEQVLHPVRNIQKVVGDMRQQRRMLTNTRRQLLSVVNDPDADRPDPGQDKKKVAIALSGLGGLKKDG